MSEHSKATENLVDELKSAARRLADSVEYDVNGTHGKGGNGGLVSNDTIKASGDLFRLLDKMEKAP